MSVHQRKVTCFIKLSLAKLLEAGEKENHKVSFILVSQRTWVSRNLHQIPASKPRGRVLAHIYDWISILFTVSSRLNAAVVFMGVRGGLDMRCAWPDSCCLSEAAGFAGDMKSFHQVWRKSEDEAKAEDVASDESVQNPHISPFCHPFFQPGWFLPLRSSFPLCQERILGAPACSEWECCRPSPRRARRGCTAADCSGPNCVE